MLGKKARKVEEHAERVAKFPQKNPVYAMSAGCWCVAVLACEIR